MDDGYKRGTLFMLNITSSFLVEKKTINDEVYASIEDPCTGNDYDDLEVMAKSVVEYRDNMSTHFSTSKGLSLPARRIFKLLSKYSDKMGNPGSVSQRYIYRWGKIVVYMVVFLAILGMAVLSASIVREDRDSRSEEFQGLIEHEVSCSSKEIEYNTIKKGYNKHNYLFNRSTVSATNRTLQNISFHLVGDFPPQLHYVGYGIFGWFILIATMVIATLYTLDKNDKKESIEIDRFRNIQTLFECLKKVKGDGSETRDRVFYKNEIFSKREVIDALCSVKNNNLPISEKSSLVDYDRRIRR